FPPVAQTYSHPAARIYRRPAAQSDHRVDRRVSASQKVSVLQKTSSDGHASALHRSIFFGTPMAFDNFSAVSSRDPGYKKGALSMPDYQPSTPGDHRRDHNHAKNGHSRVTDDPTHPDRVSNPV